MDTATAPQPEPRAEDRHQHDARDRALFDAWHAGDRVAGNRLLKFYFARLRRYFLVRAQGEHEDLLQETFARVLDKYDDFKRGSFRAFLFGVARKLFFEFLRRRYRLQNIDPYTDSLAAVSKGNFSSRLAAREDQRLLLDALAQLSLEDQDLLDLYHWQGLTARELGEVFERTEGTIRSRLRAARKRLVARFNELAELPHSTELSVEAVEARLLELRAVIGRPMLRPETGESEV